MRTLVLTNRPVMLWRHGYDLRVAHLCRHLEGERHLMVIPLQAPDRRPPTIDLSTCFDTTLQLPTDFVSGLSWRRHFRLSDTHVRPRAAPRAYSDAVNQVRRRVADVGATHLVVFGGHLAEIAREAGCDATLFDVCDSNALTLRRRLQYAGGRPWGPGRWRSRLDLLRLDRFEGGLPRWFRAVTTINEADSDEVRRLAGNGVRNVHTVPNGVADAFLAPLTDAPRRRGVAFWGNLHFAPNAAALRHFIDDIYLPHLQQHDVEVAIAGDNPPEWLRNVASRDPNVKVLGYVDDLVAAVRDYAVMVNPMLLGSGMKNKVLEAFGLGLAVVSTRLGMESVPQAVDGQHWLQAERPADFAEAVRSLLDDEPRRRRISTAANRLVHEHYRWNVVARRFQALLEAAA
jgi:glycosyltransferase involved in cell wall biosynthesis